MANVSRHNRDLTIWRRRPASCAPDPLNVEFDIKWSIPSGASSASRAPQISQS